MVRPALPDKPVRHGRANDNVPPDKEICCMTDCIDLLERFGNSYKVREVGSDGHAKTVHKRHYDPWQLELPCTHGHIYPQGGNRLGAATDKRGPVSNRLAELPGVLVVQDGDDGINAAFEVDLFDSVAPVMKPKRVRKLTPEQREEAAQHLAKVRPQPCLNRAAESAKASGWPETTPKPSVPSSASTKAVAHASFEEGITAAQGSERHRP